MILRCTAKLLSTLKFSPVPDQSHLPAVTDWYANLIWIERRKCLLVTHAGTLFSAFTPDVRVETTVYYYYDAVYYYYYERVRRRG